MSTEIQRNTDGYPRPRSEMEAVEIAFRIGAAAAQAGNYKSKNEAELALRVKYGMEMGLGPATALQAVTVINGSPALGAGAIAAKMGGHPSYDYEVTEHTDERCTIVVHRYKRGEWRACPPSTFTMEDAATAGLLRQGPWKQYPRNMLFARALTNAARFHAAEVFGGAVYTPDELGAEVDEQGEVVTVSVGNPATEIVEPPEPEPVAIDSGDSEWNPEGVIAELKAEFGAEVVKTVFTKQNVRKYADLTPENLGEVMQEIQMQVGNGDDL
jgi:hypothetical protein